LIFALAVIALIIAIGGDWGTNEEVVSGVIFG
jgi:hypothetical protein